MKRVLGAVGLGIGVLIVYFGSFGLLPVLHMQGWLTNLTLAVRIVYLVPVVFGFLGGMLASWKIDRRGWIFAGLVGLVFAIAISLFLFYSFIFVHETSLLCKNPTGASWRQWIGGLPYFLLIIISGSMGGWLGQKLSKQKQQAVLSE